MTIVVRNGFSPPVIVGALATKREPLPYSLTCREVDQWFRKDDERRSVVLKGPDGSAALINRSAFYQNMLGPAGFGWALYANKPVGLLKTANGLVVHAETPAVDAALRLLVEKTVSSDDDLLVVGGDTEATISTATLLAELARDQTEQAGRLEALVQNLSDVIVVVDDAGTICFSTSSSADTGAHQAPHQVGRSSYDEVHPDDRSNFQRFLSEACERPETTIKGELRLQDGGGGYLLSAVAVTDHRPHPGIGGIVLTYRDITATRAFEQKLRHLALHDGLTGLANRALLQDRITHALAGSSRSGTSLALLYIDLDGFKEVNDAWGHATGDVLLQRVSAVLQAQTRSSDTVARMGGDEFVVLLEQLDGVSDAAGFAARIHQALEEVVVDGLRVKVSCSVGIAVGDDLDPDRRTGRHELHGRRGAHQASRRGHVPRKVRGAQPHEVVAGVHRTPDGGGQPVQHRAVPRRRAKRAPAALPAHRQRRGRRHVRLRGPGALAAPDRRAHPPREVHSPRGAVRCHHPLTRWVLRQACTDGTDLLADRRPPFTMAVNLSAVELARPGLAKDVSGILAATGFPASLLELEITETALVSNFALARSSIRGLKAIGVTIAIDDFGTGYSSLSYLHELPVDRVKIDKTFTDRVTDEAGASLVKGVIDLAHSLHLRVTAEGIETAPQAEALASFRCDQGQGFYHAYPVPIEKLQAGAAAAVRERASGEFVLPR